MTSPQREDKVSQLEELKVKQEKLKEEVERLRQDKDTAEEPEIAAKDEHKKVCLDDVLCMVSVMVISISGVVCLEMGGRSGGKEGCRA